MRGSDLQERLAWLIGVRAVIGTTLLGTATFAEITAPGSFPVNPSFLLIGMTYGLTILWALTLRFVNRWRWLIDLQLSCDALIVSAFIYLTGGVSSLFSSLYVLPILAASTVQSRRGSLLVATLSTALYVGIVVAQHLVGSGLLHDPWLLDQGAVLPPRSVAEYTVALNVFGFFAVALLSGTLAERVRSAGVRLERASLEIADLQALNQHVINSLPSGLVTTDRAQRILTFNNAASAITGVPRAEAVGQPVVKVLQLPSDLARALNDGLQGASAKRVEGVHRTSDGRGEIELGFGVSHLETPDGRAGFLITFQDVTDMKRLERDARRRQRLAAVGEMAAGMAHEIRNPLASMSGSMQLLRQELQLNAEQAQLMDIVLRESERLNGTIGSFLAYARPQRLAVRRFDVRRVLRDTARLLRNSADVREAHVIDVAVPEQELLYEADEGQITQIVWNLATNGLRAMPDGGRLRLVGASGRDGGIVIQVEDEGIGIPADELDGLFQPFRGNFAKGTGLGLAIVHRIVSDYQGELQVNSKVGVGTTIAVQLPGRVEVAA
jgi:two-component system sensor histidine kinase PilS (NtrC family)